MVEPARLVLIVEDDFANNELMSEVLKIHGFRVEGVQDGQDALDLFEKIDPSLVIIDIGVPTVDGLEVCRRMRMESQVPILMVTGRAGGNTANSILEAGADAYLAKPFDIEEFLRLVEGLVDGSSDSPSGPGSPSCERSSDAPDITTIYDHPSAVRQQPAGSIAFA